MSGPGAPAVHVPPPRQTISLMLCNYNHGRFIGSAIDSILAQTRQPDELLIMDDGSSDDSMAVIGRYAERHAFIKAFRKEKNEGYIRGSIDLTARARGDFVHRTSADDQLHPNFVSTLMGWADRHPDVGIVSGGLLIGAEGTTRRLSVGIAGWSSGRYDAATYRRDYVEVEEPGRSLAPSTIFRRTAVEALGGWRDDLGIWEVTFSLHAAALAFDMCYAEEPVHTWMLRSGSWTSRSTSDVEASVATFVRYYATLRSPPFRDLFGDVYPRRWLTAMSRQCVEERVGGLTGLANGHTSVLYQD